jgi:hypothetical protein
LKTQRGLAQIYLNSLNHSVNLGQINGRPPNGTGALTRGCRGRQTLREEIRIAKTHNDVLHIANAKDATTTEGATELHKNVAKFAALGRIVIALNSALILTRYHLERVHIDYEY